MTLSELRNGEKGIIVKVRGRGAFRKRITEMGFIKGQEVKVIKNAPLKDPIEYKIMGYNVSLRRSEAGLIDIYSDDECREVLSREQMLQKGRRRLRKGRFRNRHNAAEIPVFDEDFNLQGMKTCPRQAMKENFIMEHFYGTHCENFMKKKAVEKGKVIDIALVGNPNCGKTTLFNYASGSRERVGNYGGVTVDSKEAIFMQDGYTFNLNDLPGTYSITAYTPEELYVRNFIIDNAPDIVINVIDASNLERNLYLTSQLIDMDIKVIIALNMFDELEKSGDQFDYETLGKMMGIPIVPTVSSKGIGIKELFSKAIEVYEDQDRDVRHIHINYGNEIEKSIALIQQKIRKEENLSLTDLVSSRFLSLKLLEKDRDAEQKILEKCVNSDKIKNIVSVEQERLEKLFNDDTETLLTDAKYGFIAGALTETCTPAAKPVITKSERIDRFITNKLLGFPIFLFFMWLTFTLTFSLGEYPMNWIDSSVSFISQYLSANMADSILKQLLIDGAIAGMGGVIIFLPNILILFFMISLMEDTGYMARAAFIMDKLMHRIGLHGRSFIPLIMGFGCNVPAIMATRTIESRSDRLLTMLIIPFMSCSARLPVYVLFIGAFFPESPGTILFIIYLAGAAIAILSARILKKTLFRSEDIPFVMELPPYRTPRIRTSLKHTWEKGVEYLKKIAGIVLVASILIWALSAFPSNTEFSKNYSTEIASIEKKYSSIPVTDESTLKKNELIKELHIQKESEKLEKSYIGRIGHFVQPVLAPMGFDWKISVSILTGLAAKEVVVGTMGVLYHVDDEVSETSQTLINNLKNQTHSQGPDIGKKVFTKPVAFGFILFILLYFPCVGVIAAIKRESGTWKWAIFSALYTTSVAWIISFAVIKIWEALF